MSSGRRIGIGVAALSIVAGGLVIWLLGARQEQADALTLSANVTERQDSVRFSFDASFSVDILDLKGAGNRLADLNELIEQRLAKVNRLLKGSAFDVRVLEDLDLPALLEGDIALDLSGRGAYGGSDRVHVFGSIGIDRPLGSAGSIEVIRVGNEVFLRSGKGSWLAVGTRVPIQVLRPIGSGLGELTDWIREGAPGAELVGEEVSDGTATDRYRITIPVDDPVESTVTNYVDFWISKGDSLLRRMLVVHKIDYGRVKVDGTFDVSFFDHGADIGIEPPTDVFRAEDIDLPSDLRARLRDLDFWVGSDLPGPRV